jgi:2-polyprenyl-6-methoxyphenol hydroxylase-like FAD-dependent oxidoreductase
MTNILIVGAGIGGLALARALQGFDYSIDIAERCPIFSPAGVGIVLLPNGLEALAQLGLLEEVNAVSNLIARMQLVRGKSTLTIPLSQVWEGARPSTRALLRADLHQVLCRGALNKDRHNVRCWLNRRVVRVESRNCRAEAHFADGSMQVYDLIVGADGVHSSVRQAVVPESRAASTDLFYFRWLAENVLDVEPDTWQTIERAGYSYGFIPVGPNRIHCFVQLTAEAAPCQRGEEASWLEHTFADQEPALVQSLRARFGAIHADFAWIVYPAYWGVGRCVLVGDSAHAMSPTLSEGGSLAMEDALVLAVALRQSDSVCQAIELYRSAREKRIAWTLRMSLAQLNSLRRGRVVEHTSAQVAISYLRHVYEPLREDPVPKALASTNTNATSPFVREN